MDNREETRFDAYEVAMYNQERARDGQRQSVSVVVLT